MSRHVLFAAAVTVALSTAGGAQAACEKMDKVTSAWLPIMQTTAYYVALNEKLFEKACIEIDSNKMESPNQIIDALIAGRADFGPPGAAAGIAMIAESKFPGKLKIFGLQGGGIKADRINDGLIVKPDSPIKSFADLKGKTLGHVPGIQWRTISRHMVRAAGLDPDKDVKLIDLAVAMQVPAVVGGSVDATLSLEPVGSIAVASGKAIRAVTNPCSAVIADPFYSGASVMTTKFLKERPEVAKRVVAVIDQATDMVNADFAKYKTVLPTYTAIKADQLELVAQPYLRGFKDLNDTDIKSYQALVDIFIKEGVMDGPLNVRDKLLTKAELGN
ncbi:MULTISPECIES: ABC transporter substrate-binding protein [Rhodopseudomonas]|uniref:Nitrate ABC transporter substrate-binding protein n=1 Tax=Rhodopseudomonas palustris TaxID=1076 RepID=A0A0D7EWK1_RHOPL|nr:MULTISPECIES: ABC transporter substrate-binding protein [Rhodopseudomonas]KIZ43812.1 nitrate ABC transporter substrate-binding protein [Rhodopseudomonas palustris]MDF3813654.1 ABC transporter substrate-binding protein [Rhodopseudomonas sp. BAL398]WOK15990.1 ABC transporter substrate-binding protein [Rhodopseudomonas sp. BAL398]